MKTRRLDQVAQSIRVLIQQGEKSITKCTTYTNQEKILLIDFINTLKVFYLQRDPVENLKYTQKLIKSIEGYLEQYFKNNSLFFKYPFLWFTCTFLDSLKKMLLSEKESFSIMLIVLREVVPLMLKGIPLTNIDSWEKIQLSSNLQLFTFLDGLYEFNFNILQNIEEMGQLGLISLNSRRIYDNAKPFIIKRPHNRSYKDIISLFFELTNLLWSIEFSYKAFDIEWFYLQLKMKEGENLENYIKLPSNSVLDLSMIHKINIKDKNEFVGFISIPKGEKQTLMDYIDPFERDGKIETSKLLKIKKTSSSLSYTFYDSGKGWNFERYPKIIHPNSFYLTEEPSTSWYFKNEEETFEFVKTFCKFNNFISYHYLKSFIGDFTFKEERKKIFGLYNDNMFHLFKQNALNIKHLPLGLINSFTLNKYEITIQNRMDSQINDLLPLLPYSEIYYLENGFLKIVTNLNDELLSLIKEKFLCSIRPTQWYYNVFRKAELRYFNENSQTWKLNL